MVGAPQDSHGNLGMAGSVYFFEAGAACYAEGEHAGSCVCKEGATGELCDARPDCGDGVVQDAEQCDNAEANGLAACAYNELSGVQ